jgi:hypothetical protein
MDLSVIQWWGSVVLRDRPQVSWKHLEEHCGSVRHLLLCAVDRVWNVMAHAQKPDFVFRRKGRVHLNRQWASVQSTAGSWGVRISGTNAGYTTFRGSVKSTGYPLHSPVSPSLPLPCVTVCHHISTGFSFQSCCEVVTSAWCTYLSA